MSGGYGSGLKDEKKEAILIVMGTDVARVEAS
jgi:hypothetical protein